MSRGLSQYRKNPRKNERSRAALEALSLKRYASSFQYIIYLRNLYKRTNNFNNAEKFENLLFFLITFAERIYYRYNFIVKYVKASISV